MKIFLHLAVNDDNGNLTDECEAMSVRIDGDTALEFECSLSILEIPNNILQIGNVTFPYTTRGTMVGNVYWNAYQIEIGDLIILLNSLRDNDAVQLNEGWAHLFDIWHGGDRFDVEDFLDWSTEHKISLDDVQ